MICTRCKLDKPEQFFSWKNRLKGKKSLWCKSCMSDHQKGLWSRSETRKSSVTKSTHEKKKRNLQLAWDYLAANPCSNCGEDNPIVLEFHHRDPASKYRTVSYLAGTSCSIEKIILEIGKCDILCSNCHRIVTAKDQGWYKYIDQGNGILTDDSSNL